MSYQLPSIIVKNNGMRLAHLAIVEMSDFFSEAVENLLISSLTKKVGL